MNTGKKKFAEMEKLYFFGIQTQIDNSMPTFFFNYPIFSYLKFSSFYLMSSNEQSEQSQDNSQPELNEYNQLNFFIYTDPGIYKIVCTVNGKVYIGEAKNLLDRMNKHFKDLENGLSDCHELQRDWNSYGKYCFRMEILLKGQDFLTKQNRLQKETEILNLYEPDEVYNQHPRREIISEDNYRVICEINGQRFESIKQASEQLNMAENSIRRRLFNQQPNYLVIGKVRQGYEPIIANGTSYESIMAAVRDGQAKDRFQAMRFLKAKSRRDWNYISPEKRINKD